MNCTLHRYHCKWRKRRAELYSVLRNYLFLLARELSPRAREQSAPTKARDRRETLARLSPLACLRTYIGRDIFSYFKKSELDISVATPNLADLFYFVDHPYNSRYIHSLMVEQSFTGVCFFVGLLRDHLVEVIPWAYVCIVLGT